MYDFWNKVKIKRTGGVRKVRNKWKNAWKELVGNRGSGVLLVLVAISCITLMAVSLLHLSYTAFKIKAAERQGKIDFYTADAKVDELLAGVQAQVSDAIAEAQKKTLIEYQSYCGLTVTVTETTLSSEGEATTESSTESIVPPEATTTTSAEFDNNLTEVFQTTFLDELQKWAENVDAKEAFDGIYDMDILRGFFAAGSAVTFEEDGNCTYIKDTENKLFTLQNVRFIYTSAKSGYVTNVKLDIVIHVPDFYYVQEGDSVSLDPNPSAAPAEWKMEELVTFENWSTY